MDQIFSQILEKAAALKNQKLSNPKASQELKSEFDLSLKKDSFEGDLSEIINKIFNHSVNTQNPRFLNQLYGGSRKEAWAGELLVSILNTSMATYEIAPLFTLMEAEIIETVNKRLEYKNVKGLMVPGGSYANMLGIHCARYKMNPRVKVKGNQDSDFKIFVSEDAHYSFEKALGLMGMGTESLVKVKSDKNKKMDLVDLDKKIKKSIDQGSLPICVVSTAGTTVWGSFDPIEGIQKICDKYDLWHHVDAAWGALALWSSKKEDYFPALKNTDSITIDFHKLLASTLTKGIFITSHPDVLMGANSGGGGKYIFHKESEEDNQDTGVFAIQCGRKVDSLPVWLQWKIGGTKQYNEKFDQLSEVKNYSLDLIKSNPKKYRLVLEPEYFNICFQVLPPNADQNIGDYNRALREKLMNNGNFMVNFSSTNEDGAFFRLVLSHWDLNKEIIKEFFAELDYLAQQ